MSGVGAGVAAAVVRSKPSRAVVISSRNGNQFKNGGPRTAVHEAYERIARGEDVLDAILAGVNIVENDPLDDSVGYGGIPNADGVVQLDACVMHGPKKRAGGVAALEGVRTSSLVARAVMEQTDHHLLVGEGAQRFARQLGFKIEDDLNTEHSRKLWLEWKRRIDPSHYLDPDKRISAGARARETMLADGLLSPERYYGTIHMSAINTKGELCGATTTSGLSFKIPGRVGDSPILGAGNYVDQDVGACGSTGRGEANLFGLSSYLVVEEMRRGTQTQGRDRRGAPADQGQHRREAPVEARRHAELQRPVLCDERLGRARRHGDVRRRRPASTRSATRPDRVSSSMDALLPGKPAD